MLSHKIVKNIFNAAVCDMMIEENGSLTPSEQRILQQVADWFFLYNSSAKRYFDIIIVSSNDCKWKRL